jgi:transcription antitermination factor NusG
MELVWRAFYTRPKHEKKVHDRLLERGYEVYCPLMKTRVRWSDRWKKVYKPVLPGYIFAHVDERQRLEVVQDASIINTVFWNKMPAVVRDEEIAAMQYLLNGAGEDFTDSFSEGDLVSITNGDFRGLKGVVVRVDKQTLSLRLESLQLDFVVQIPARMVNPIL